MAKRSGFQFKDIHGFVQSLFGEDMHAKRVYSLANATLGVMTSASLAVHAIGLGLAQARGLLTKHAVKQVDRLMSNQGIDVWASFAKNDPKSCPPGTRRGYFSRPSYTFINSAFFSIPMPSESGRRTLPFSTGTPSAKPPNGWKIPG